jgi:hypothetical protein
MYFGSMFCISCLSGAVPRLLQSEDTELKKLGHLKPFTIKADLEYMAAMKWSISFGQSDVTNLNIHTYIHTIFSV